jgi:hypothetical protein
MKPRRVIRLVLALLFLCVACILLAWAFWPFGDVSHVLPIPPENLQLPTPEGMLFGLRVML